MSFLIGDMICWENRKNPNLTPEELKQFWSDNSDEQFEEDEVVYGIITEFEKVNKFYTRIYFIRHDNQGNFWALYPLYAWTLISRIK
jgi:hypothetical protein